MTHSQKAHRLKNKLRHALREITTYISINLNVYLSLISFLIGLLFIFFFLKHFGKLDLYPSTAISLVAVFFSYMAYLHTKEKFRLDLMKDRLEIYTSIVNYCSSLKDLYNYDDNTTDAEKSALLEEYKIILSDTQRYKLRFLFGEPVFSFSQSLHWQAEQLFLTLQRGGHIFPQTKQFALEMMEFSGLMEPYLDFSSYKRH